MNKTSIKNFAIWARKKLIADIVYKAGLLGITEKGIQNPLQQSTKDVQFFDIGTKDPYQITGEEIKQRTKLIEGINLKALDSDYKTAYISVVEEVAYTWFNRLVAIRFMEVNDYLTSRVRVLSSESAAKKEPDLVTRPFEAELEFTQIEKETILKLTHDNKMDELFRMLFIKQCNALNQILPNLFEGTSHYTELLLNISFTDQEGVVYHLINDIDEDDFNVEKEGQVEIIGWLYQYYNTEPKDEAFALLKKNVKITKERIPAATQLFTPDWIVRYMVENSLGRLWVEGHPNEELKSTWKYYLEEVEQEEDVKAQLDKIREEYKSLKPEGIKVIDPCMGSGHILVYAFDVLMQIYESNGYSQREAAKSILENNIFGLDIDNRAYQLSYFALMMKARSYNRRILDGNQKCHVYSIQESNGINKSQLAFFGSSLSDFERNTATLQAQKLIETYIDAKEFGSILNVEPMNWELLGRFSEDLDFGSQLSLEAIGIEDTQRRLKEIVQIAEIMARKYDVVVTNPPYMGLGNGNAKLNEYVKKYFPENKADLYSVFIETCIRMVKKGKFVAMITQHSWMFLLSFEKLRQKLVYNTLINMAHLGARAFEEIGGEVVQTTSFVYQSCKIQKYNSCFKRLIEFNNHEDKEHAFLLNDENIHIIDTDKFNIVPANPLTYWMSKAVIDSFSKGKSLGSFAYPKQGLATADNEKFLRQWYEVDIRNIEFNLKGISEINQTNAKWFPHCKGGSYRKWYGNRDYVINWKDNGSAIKNFKKAVVRNPDFYFKEGFSYSDVSTGDFALRYYGNGFVFDSSGPMIFIERENLKANYLLGLMNSVVANKVLSFLCPTIHYTQSSVAKFPLIIQDNELVNDLVSDSLSISIQDWNFYETSWDFKSHPLVSKGLTKEAFVIWDNNCRQNFEGLKSNEEQLNKFFIELYGLEDDLTPNVEDTDVTIRKADLQRDIKSFISYAVGCMFGRYSLDFVGLAFAGGQWDDSKYSKYIPDKDNCIPITDDEYFKDDILTRFIEFIKVVYGQETLEENLDFIAKALDVKGNSSREIIRNYFVKDFYKDHVKIYQKRPIYWLYDSGKQDGFKVLIYMHRYTADTTGIVRVDYLHTLQKKYATEIENLKDFAAKTDNAREAAQAQKRIEKLKKQLNETESYDEKLGHLALSRISIDLDDGVKMNYEKVQTDAEGLKYEILAKI